MKKFSIAFFLVSVVYALCLSQPALAGCAAIGLLHAARPVYSTSLGLMVEGAITGVTEKKDIQIQRACRSITIITKTNAIAAAVRVTLKHVTGGQNKMLYNDFPILDLAEIMAQGEGMYLKNATAYQGSIPSGVLSALKIPVSDGVGAYDIGDGYLSLDLTGLTSGTTYEIYCDESLYLNGRMIEIDRNAVQAPKAQQKFMNAGSHFIALPKTNFTKVQMFGKNGNDIIKEATELSVDSFYENDVVTGNYRTIATTPVVNINDVIYGYDNLLIVNIEDLKAYEVYCTGVAGYEFYVGRYMD